MATPWPKWKRGNESNLSTTAISNGQILVTIDSGRMFIDIDNSRIEISDVIRKTESEILAILAPLQKLYLATDTGALYYHNGTDWVKINSDTASKIKATLANTTKGYVLGLTASGETPIYDEEVYLDTVLGNFHAKTFNGYTLADACAKSISDSTSASAISTGSNLVTERDVYYGLPNINGVHTYNSSTSIYAPTAVGTSGYLLKSGGSGAPSWADPSGLTVGAATKATQDASGNVITSTYAKLASPIFTGTPKAPTPDSSDNSTTIATTAYVTAAVNSVLGANDAMVFKGTIGTGGTVTALPATHSTGWTYRVITAGTYAGVACEVGDMIVCITDGTASTDSHWTVIQTNIDGAVVGPSSSVDAHVAVFNGTTGKVIKDSGYTIATSVPSGAKFTDTTYSVMGAASSSAAGSSGLVPAPAAGNQSSFLRGDGTWDTPTDTDTKNTAGSTDSSSKLFLIGATSQAASPQTYSQDTAYVGTDGHLYSNSKQVVNLSDTQALTNKTYNGYTLAAACAKDIADSTSASAISTGSNLVTERDVYYGLPTINNSHAYTSSTTIYAPTAGGTSGYLLKANGSTSTPTWLAPATLLANLGCGYGTCATAETTVAKVVTLSNYALITGGLVAIKFTYAVPASATLNINSKGAKAIYHNGSAIEDGVIEADTIALFVYDGTNYNLIAADFNAGNDYGNHLELEGTYAGYHLEME